MTSGPLSSGYSERYTGQLRPKHYLYFAIRSTWRWASIESGQLLILGLKSQLFAEYLSFYTVSSCRSDFFGSSRNTDRNYPCSALLYCTWHVISGLTILAEESIIANLMGIPGASCNSLWIHWMYRIFIKWLPVKVSYHVCDTSWGSCREVVEDILSARRWTRSRALMLACWWGSQTVDAYSNIGRPIVL